MKGIHGGVVVLGVAALAGCGDVSTDGPEVITLPSSEQRVAVPAPSARVAPGTLAPRTPELAIQAPREVDPGDVVWLLLTNEAGTQAEVGAQWRQTRGPAVEIQDADGTAAWFHAPDAGEDIKLAFEVHADFGDGLSGGGEVSLVLHHGDARVDGGDEDTGGEPGSTDEAGDVVVFTADKDLDNRFELYATTLEGAEAVRLNAPLAPGGDVTNFRVSPDGRYVVFQTFESSEPRVYVARTDGSEVREVVFGGTTVTGYPNAPWAPDSSRVAVITDDARLLTARPNGSGAIQVSDNPVDGRRVDRFFVRWSPTSRFLAYIADANVDGVFELFVTRANRQQVRRLSGPMPRGGDVQSLEWSPSGDRVAYWADQVVDNEFQVFAATLDGRRFTLSPPPSGPGFDSLLDWAPDGSRLLYRARLLGTVFELFTTRADGTGNTRVAAAGSAAGFNFASWTSDSASIVYVRGGGTTGEFFVTGPEGQGTRLLYQTPPSSFSTRPVLSPDGRRFAFTETEAGNERLLIVELADGVLTEVESASDVETPRWHPEDTHLVYAARFGPLTFPITATFDLLSYRLADGAHPVIGDHGVDPFRVAFSRDGSRVVYASLPIGFGATRRLFLTTPNADAPVRDLSGFITPGGSVSEFAQP